MTAQTKEATSLPPSVMLKSLPANSSTELYTAMLTTFAQEGIARSCEESFELLIRFLLTDEVKKGITENWQLYNSVEHKNVDSHKIYERETVVINSTFDTIIEKLQHNRSVPTRRIMENEELSLLMRADLLNIFFKRCMPQVSPGNK